MIDLRLGDALTLAKELPDQSIQTIVTSPPYWGLRDYGACSCGSGRFNLGQGDGTGGNLNYRPSQGFDPNCPKCNGSGRIDGTSGQLGLERTPEEYVCHLVELFRELRRALKDDGTAWVNLGDSFWGGKGQSGANSPEYIERRKNRGSKTLEKVQHCIGKKGWTKPGDGKHEIIKPKDLVGIPWRVAFALQADGWYLRSDIIWHKPNPMPESVRDRPTKSHEYIFLLSKNAKYYYDSEAVKEQGAAPREFLAETRGDGSSSMINGRASRQAKGASGFGATGQRNRRSVWTVTTKPFKGAHFATFPEALIEPCILAGARAGDIVLDPFSGAGTTGVVSKRHGRSYIGFELNPDYLEMSQARIDKVQVALPLEVERC